MSEKGTDVDTVLNVLGGKGLYQHVQHLLMVLCSFSAAFQLLDMIFIGRIIPHKCSAPPNGTGITVAGVELSSSNFTVEYGQCNIYVKYNTTNSTNTEHTLPCIYGMTYTERKDASIVSQFDLVCERGALGDLPQTLLILGQAIGALVLPFFSDRYGRKSANIVSHVGVLGIGVATAFSNSYITFAILRFLMGIIQQGIVLTMATYAIEVYPTVYRRYVGGVGTVVWGTCVVSLTPFGYFLRMESWRTQQLAFCSVSLYVIIQIIFLDESFRWLVANGKYDIALKNIKKAARWNKVDVHLVVDKFNELIGRQTVTIPPKAERGDQLLLKDDKTKPIKKIEKYTLLDILKRKKLALNTVILWYLWCTAALSYFGLFFTSSSLAGDKYLNFFLNALMEFPPGLIFLLLIDRYGRKKTLATFYALCGTGMILATIIRVTSDSYTASICITILSLVGKLGAGGAFGTCFFYTPEIFPTNLRNVGLGSASIAARVGGMLGPFSRVLAQHISWGPGAIFGSCCLLATLLITILPETKGKELPQTMADMKLLYKKIPDGSTFKVKNGKTKIYKS